MAKPMISGVYNSPIPQSSIAQPAPQMPPPQSSQPWPMQAPGGIPQATTLPAQSNPAPTSAYNQMPNYLPTMAAVQPQPLQEANMAMPGLSQTQMSYGSYQPQS